jgi:hypothetical protein
MKRAKAVFVAILAFSLAGCVLLGKPKPVPTPPPVPQPAPAPVPPPEPLSIPQTHVDFPAPQTLNPESLVTSPPVEEPAPQVPAKPAPQLPRSHTAAAPPQPKQPVDPPPAEPSRPLVQEILPENVQKQFQSSAEKHMADTNALLVAPHRRLNANERRMEGDIRQFLELSRQAVSSGDMRSADQLAERAYILAKELLGGK